MIGKGNRIPYWMAAILVTLAMGFSLAIASEKVPRMTKEQLKEMIGKPEVVVLDVRSTSDWGKDQTKILGAIREDPNKPTKSWAEKYGKDKTIVLYCAWPSEGTSARVAQEMISLGFTKVYALKGGWKDWLKANFPTEAK